MPKTRMGLFVTINYFKITIKSSINCGQIVYKTQQVVFKGENIEGGNRFTFLFPSGRIFTIYGGLHDENIRADNKDFL